jgi:hypothetical protein
MKTDKIQLFESRQIRALWDENAEKWWFSVVDIIAILTESDNPRHYWTVLKGRLIAEGNETVTNCERLKMLAPDSKMRLTDVADTKQIFRIIQSIPSKKAEPFKLWLADVAKQRLDQVQDPELSIEQAMRDYRRLGYSEEWINTRLQSIQFRKELTDEWKKAGVEEGLEYAILTSLLNILAEASATEISKEKNPKDFHQSQGVALEGAKVAKDARKSLEQRTGKSAISPLNAKELPGRKENTKQIEE